MHVRLMACIRGWYIHCLTCLAVITICPSSSAKLWSWIGDKGRSFIERISSTSSSSSMHGLVAFPKASCMLYRFSVGSVGGGVVVTKWKFLAAHCQQMAARHPARNSDTSRKLGQPSAVQPARRSLISEWSSSLTSSQAEDTTGPPKPS